MDGIILSKLIIALHTVQHPQQGMGIQVVLVLQLLLHLLTTKLILAILAQVHVISIEVRISPASQTDITGLSQSTSSSTAVAAELMASILLGHVFRLDVVT